MINTNPSKNVLRASVVDRPPVSAGAAVGDT